MKKDNDIKASMKGSKLICVTFCKAQLPGADLSKCKFIACILKKANLSSANFSNGSFFACDFSGSNISNANFSNSDLSNAGINDANMSGANLSNAVLISTEFVRTNLTGANFNNADLLNANLRGSNLTNANFRNASLLYTDFSNTILMGADFTDAEIEVEDTEILNWLGPKNIKKVKIGSHIDESHRKLNFTFESERFCKLSTNNPIYRMPESGFVNLKHTIVSFTFFVQLTLQLDRPLFFWPPTFLL
jgi:hypothetical protein